MSISMWTYIYVLLHAFNVSVVTVSTRRSLNSDPHQFPIVKSSGRSNYGIYKLHHSSNSICSVTVMIQFTTYLPLLILTGILGALRSLVHIAQPIVMAEHVPIELYPSAYGLYMLLAGAISLSVGPMIGENQLFNSTKILVKVCHHFKLNHSHARHW